MFTFRKSEHMTSLKEIDALFERGHNSSAQTYPVRAVYQLLKAEEGVPTIKVLVSVAKKRLHHAVDRNRAKRQLREAYRLQHQELSATLQKCGKRMHIAFVWLADGPQPTDKVFESLRKIMETINARLNVHETKAESQHLSSVSAPQD